MVMPGVRRSVGVVVEARPFWSAEACADERITDHRITNGDAGDLRTDLVYPSSVLVAGYEREWGGHVARDDVEIGAAHAGSRDFDDNVEGPSGARCRKVVEHERRGARVASSSNASPLHACPGSFVIGPILAAEVGWWRSRVQRI